MQPFGVSDKSIRELAGVNHAFISLLAMSHSGGAPTNRFGLDPAIVRRIQLLDAAAVARMVGRPFPLFCLRFHDIAAWEAVMGQGVREEGAALQWPAQGGHLLQFTVMGLAAIRSVAAREPLSASVLFGVPPEVAAGLGQVQIRALPAISATVRSWLRARCAGIPDWWDGLILSACAADSAGPEVHRGVHGALLSALNLRQASVPEGRLYRNS